MHLRLAFVIGILAAGRSAKLPAQPLQRFSVTVGPTVLPMNTRSGSTNPAAIATARVNAAASARWSAGLSVLAIKPLMVTTVAADCVPYTECPSYRSPDALYGASAEFAVATRNRKLRASVGVGFLSAQNLSDVTATNSPTLEVGIEYAILPTRRVSPVISVRVQRLTRDVAGLEAIVLPTFGIVF